MAHAFPPDDGWCVEITEAVGGAPVERVVFDLAEDAREHAKRHAWQHKHHRAEVTERRGGATVFRTVIAFPRDLPAATPPGSG